MTQGAEGGGGSQAAELEERRRTVERLEQKATELSSLFGSMTDVIVEVDWDGRILRAAPTKADFSRFLQPAYEGSSLHDMLPAGRADEVVTAIRGAIETGGPVG